MKRVIATLLLLAAATLAGAQTPVRPQTNHTVSTTLGAGLEYGFEWAFAGQATLVARAGYASKGFSLTDNLEQFYWRGTMSPAITLEPRYYLLMNWRENHGKYTYGNSAEFVGVPVMYTLKGELAVSPVLGVRRAFEKHWFHEFTAGVDLLCLPRTVISPRIGYRIGYLF